MKETNGERFTWPSRMSASDALLWLLDAIPELRSTIGALILLERAPSRERLGEEVERLTRRVVRMRQRVAEVPWNLAPPEWVDDDQFDLDYHLRSVAVPAPGGMSELLEELSPLFATPLDRSRPLWEAYIAEGLAGGQGALFVKTHHCLTDGVGGSRLFEALLGKRQGMLVVTPAPAPATHKRGSTSPAAMLWRAERDNLRDAASAAGDTARALGRAALDPLGTLGTLAGGLRTIRGFASELFTSRAESPLHHRRSLSRQLATFEMRLADIDLARKRLDATNNDIVLTVVSGAMHRWHTSRGADVKQLRSLMPVNLRASDDTTVGNQIALLAVTLPIGEPNPLRRLRLIQERVGHVKSDRRAKAYPWLARLMMAMPLSVATQLGRQQTRRTNFVCTNVPGPRQTCYLAGEAIEKIYAYAPLMGDHPVAIALMSYRDTMFVGLDVDPLAMPDLPHFLDALRESRDEVLDLGHHCDFATLDPAARAHGG